MTECICERFLSSIKEGKYADATFVVVNPDCPKHGAQPAPADAAVCNGCDHDENMHEVVAEGREDWCGIEGCMCRQFIGTPQEPRASHVYDYTGSGRNDKRADQPAPAEGESWDDDAEHYRALWEAAEQRAEAAEEKYDIAVKQNVSDHRVLYDKTDEIAKLKAENAALREALEESSDYCSYGHWEGMRCDACEKAHDLLEKTQ